MTVGNIGSWNKQPGDTLSPGEVLVEIETDKAQMDFEFQDDGVLAKVLVPSGEKDVAVGNVGFSEPAIRYDNEGAGLTIYSPLPSMLMTPVMLLLSRTSL